MKRTLGATRRMVAGGALLAAALLGAAAAAPGTAFATTTVSARPGAVAWATPHCTEAQTEIWLGLGNGGGTAGTIFYPLEFSNVGRHACTLTGYPRAWALTGAGRQIGKSSRHLSAPHGVVTLRPGRTAHASLGVIEAGNVCSKPVNAGILKVRAPRQGSSTQLSLGFQACHGKRVLVIGPIVPGVGIP
jgi:hypothetical protein